MLPRKRVKGVREEVFVSVGRDSIGKGCFFHEDASVLEAYAPRLMKKLRSLPETPCQLARAHDCVGDSAEYASELAALISERSLPAEAESLSVAKAHYLHVVNYGTQITDLSFLNDTDKKVVLWLDFTDGAP